MEGADEGGPGGIQSRLFAAVRACTRGARDVYAPVPVRGCVVAYRFSQWIHPPRAALRGTRTCKLHPPASAPPTASAGVAMALTASIDTREAAIRVEPSRARGGSNDAFSFWKPSQDWKAALDYEIAESKAVAQHYLFEEYLAREDRRPPSRMQAYYAIKSLIPAAVRHRLN